MLIAGNNASVRVEGAAGGSQADPVGDDLPRRCASAPSSSRSRGCGRHQGVPAELLRGPPTRSGRPTSLARGLIAPVLRRDHLGDPMVLEAAVGDIGCARPVMAAWQMSRAGASDGQLPLTDVLSMRSLWRTPAGKITACVNRAHWSHMRGPHAATHVPLALRGYATTSSVLAIGFPSWNRVLVAGPLDRFATRPSPRQGG